MNGIVTGKVESGSGLKKPTVLTTVSWQEYDKPLSIKDYQLVMCDTGSRVYTYFVIVPPAKYAINYWDSDTPNATVYTSDVFTFTHISSVSTITVDFNNMTLQWTQYARFSKLMLFS